MMPLCGKNWCKCLNMLPPAACFFRIPQIVTILMVVDDKINCVSMKRMLLSIHFSYIRMLEREGSCGLLFKFFGEEQIFFIFSIICPMFGGFFVCHDSWYSWLMIVSQMIEKITNIYGLQMRRKVHRLRKCSKPLNLELLKEWEDNIVEELNNWIFKIEVCKRRKDVFLCQIGFIYLVYAKL